MKYRGYFLTRQASFRSDPSFPYLHGQCHQYHSPSLLLHQEFLVLGSAQRDPLQKNHQTLGRNRNGYTQTSILTRKLTHALLCLDNFYLHINTAINTYSQGTESCFWIPKTQDRLHQHHTQHHMRKQFNEQQNFLIFQFDCFTFSEVCHYF